MSQLVQQSANKAPIVLGGGILSVTLAGLGVGIFGLSLGLLAEALAAGVGMFLAGRYA
jgi:hypothetical protein